MEKELNTALDVILKTENTRGVVVADKQGLCLAARGVASEESSGVWSALMSEACKLEPELDSPTLVLENNSKQCVVQDIQSKEVITHAIHIHPSLNVFKTKYYQFLLSKPLSPVDQGKAAFVCVRK